MSPDLNAPCALRELAPTLMAELPQGLFIINHMQKVVMVNTALLDLCGFNEAALIGRPAEFLLHPLSTPLHQAAILSALAGQSNFQGELLQQRSNGELYWAELHLVALHTASGTFSHCMGTLHDISTRKQIELELQTSEQRYLDLIEHIPAGVVVHGSNSEILHGNSRACQLDQVSVEVAGDAAHEKDHRDPEYDEC